MKKYCFTPALIAIATLLDGCSSMPTNTALLDQTRSEYIAAQSNPKVAAYASLELKQASDAYAQANAASDHGDSPEKVDKLAYLAKQKIISAQEIAKQKSIEADFTVSAKQTGPIRPQ